MSLPHFHQPSGKDSSSTLHSLLFCYCFYFFKFSAKIQVVSGSLANISFKKFNQARGKVPASPEPCYLQHQKQSPGLTLYLIDPATQTVWSPGGEKRQLPHCCARLSALVYVKRRGQD